MNAPAVERLNEAYRNLLAKAERAEDPELSLLTHEFQVAFQQFMSSEE